MFDIETESEMTNEMSLTRSSTYSTRPAVHLWGYAQPTRARAVTPKFNVHDSETAWMCALGPPRVDTYTSPGAQASAAHAGMSVSNAPRLVSYLSACRNMHVSAGAGSTRTGAQHSGHMRRCEPSGAGAQSASGIAEKSTSVSTPAGASCDCRAVSASAGAYAGACSKPGAGGTGLSSNAAAPPARMANGAAPRPAASMCASTASFAASTAGRKLGSAGSRASTSASALAMRPAAGGGEDKVVRGGSAGPSAGRPTNNSC
jgi:hypothetical protein